jgi:two-component system sensor histidine kinase UhpB
MSLVLPRSRWRGDNVRILWLEDNANDVELGLAALRRAGFQPNCQVVQSRTAFTDRLRSSPFDVVLADFQLPAWTGDKAFDILRKTDSQIPFIMVTGALPESTAIRCIQRGITDYVLKDSMARLPISLRLALVTKSLREKSARAEKALRQAETESREQLRRLAAHIESVREEERKRIAREVHDVLGQALTALKLDLAWLAARLDPSNRRLQRRALSMSRLIDSTVQTVRKITTELRPGILDQLGLFAAIEWQAEQFQARSGVRCHCAISCPDLKIESTSSITLFRVFQEILTNVARHAKARRVETTLRVCDETLLMEVKDDGRGIAPRVVASGKSLGILGMRERVHLLGGEIRFAGVRGKGTTVSVTLPIN